MSKKKSQNKKLYDKILNSHSEEDLQKLKVSAGGYTGYTCAAYVSLNGNQSLDLADLHWNEEELNVGTISVYKLDNDDGTAYPASLTIAGLPSWLSYSLIATTFTVNRYRISGTAPSYESVETVDSSDTSVFVTSPTYTIGTGECTVGGSSSFNVYIDDVNEPPYVTSTDTILCWNDMFVGQLLNPITINDPDTKTPENRNIAWVETRGPNAGLISLTGFVPGEAPISFRPVLKSTDVFSTIYTIDIVASDTKGLLATGTYTLDIIPSVHLEEPSQISTHNVQQFFIPSGLTTPHPVYLGYYTTRDTSLCDQYTCDDGSFAKAYFLNRTVGNIYADFSAGLTQDDPGIVSLYTYITNAGTYTGFFNVEGRVQPQPSECCNPSSRQFITQSYASNIVLDVFKTGIGPDINFSGGIGNVEGSYFLEGLSNNKLAVIPNDTGTTFNSEDNTFFIYNIADTGTLITGVAHSSETGIIEADGFGDHIALRYKSSPSNTFYHYTISTDSFTGISPFSSDIRRIIAVDDSRFWILGQDESVLYNPANFTYTGVDHGIYTGASGIPSNVAVVSSEDYPAICSSISNENYIFLLDEIHDSGNSHFPLVLDTTLTASGQILPRSSSSYISAANLEDYKVGYYLNYRPDIVTNLNRLVVSAEDNFGRSTLLSINHSTSGFTSIIKSMVGSGTHGRISVLRNDTLLWAGAASGAVTQIIDVPNSNVIHNVAVTGAISNVKTNLDQYRTLLLSASGDHGYIVNDYDASVEHFSFTGYLDMGRYGDIAVAEGFVGGSDNFLMLPMTTYESNTISGSLAALSTTTTAQFAVVLSTGVDDYKINETVVSLAESQVTTGEIAIGTFVITDDEFNGGNTFGFPSGIGDNDIFTLDIVGNSGTIKVKAGVALDYETKNTYTGTITGVDPYFVDQPPFADTFVLTVLDVNEPPTQIVLSPASGKIPADQDLSTDYFAAAITITDADSEILFTNNEVVIADGGYKHLFRISDDYTQLFLRENSVLDANTEYNITLLARTSGTSTYTASQNFVLSVGGYRPNGMFMNPITVTIAENTPINSLYHLADLYLTDPDSTDDNEIILTGPDSDYFTVAYTGSTNSGNLYLNANTVLDFETKSSYTGTLIGRMIGTTNTSVQKTFILYVSDVPEPSGFTLTPSVVYIDETTGNADSTFLSTVTFTDAETYAGTNVVLTAISYSTGIRNAALDPYWPFDNQTESPDIYFLSDRALDYETQSIYYLIISGYPEGQTSAQLGGLLTVIVNDVNEAPEITLNPTGTSINETTDTNFGKIKLADISIKDEQQTTVELSLGGSDAEFFEIVPFSISSDVPASSIILGELYLKSGVSLNADLQSSYSPQIIATDSESLSSTGTFLLSVTDVEPCVLSLSVETGNVLCAASTNGFVFINIDYSGDSASICALDRPLSISWNNLPESASTSQDGTFVNGIGTGTYNAYVLGGAVPITSISVDISSPPPLSVTNVAIDNPTCQDSGIITISFTGGLPPYSIAYTNLFAFVESGSVQQTGIVVNQNASGNVVVTDSNGCQASGGPYVFSFAPTSSFNFISSSPPLIHDDTVSEYKFDVSHDIGPYDMSIYNSVSGEKGSLVTFIDKYDTSVLTDIRQFGDTIIVSGVEQVITSEDLFNNPLIYEYDIADKIYPGSYVFEFTNQNNCSFLSPLQVIPNIEPLSVNVFTENDNPIDLGTNVLSQPILDTLFIPYRMIVKDSSVLSYISNIGEKSDIRLQIGDMTYDRKALYGSLYCGTYSIINIKFLGLKSNEWFFTVPFYKGFDISDTDQVDILNQDIYLVISDSKKIKVVTELNNNVSTIKLLKGSLLTTDTSINQFRENKEIELNQLLPDGTFENRAEAIVGERFTLHNKHIPGNIFMVDFLRNSDITQNLNSNTIEDVEFDCNSNQQAIQKYKNFLINLNNFNDYENIYFKSKDSVLHNAFLSLNVGGGYLDDNNSYKISYKYYDQETKQLLDLKKNNQIVVNELLLDDIKPGSYIIKISDLYGNKIKSVNDISYDIIFEQTIDYIINTLHTTKEALNFKYGDLLINIYDNFVFDNNPPPSVPGTDFEEEPEQPDNPPITITSSTVKVSPNTSYKNRLTIQTDPGKVKFVVTGPYGYNKVFDDKVELIQMPPGVYNIEGYSEDLFSKYLLQDKRKVFINTSTQILVDLFFEYYQDIFIIE